MQPTSMDGVYRLGDDFDPQAEAIRRRLIPDRLTFCDLKREATFDVAKWSPKRLVTSGQRLIISFISYTFQVDDRRSSNDFQVTLEQVRGSSKPELLLMLDAAAAQDVHAFTRTYGEEVQKIFGLSNGPQLFASLVKKFRPFPS